MNKSNEQIKYVVTEGGETFEPTGKLTTPEEGQPFLYGIHVSIGTGRGDVFHPTLRRVETPPFVERSVVEGLVAAAREADATGCLWLHGSDADTRLRNALAATEEALNPKPRERFYVDSESFIHDRQEGSKYDVANNVHMDSLAALLNELANAQVGDAA